MIMFLVLFEGKQYAIWLEEDSSGDIFFCASVLDSALQHPRLLGDHLHELRQMDEKYNLLVQLEELGEASESQWQLVEILVVESEIVVGKEGVVNCVRWCGGNFAKKDYFCKVGFARDQKKGNKVSHPNVVMKSEWNRVHTW
jgi:hypothetical protein